MHSLASDGAFRPGEVVEQAHRAGITLLALTDHDTVDGVPEAMSRGQELGVEVIPGVELSVSEDSGSRRMHLLGYGLDLQNPSLIGKLDELRWARRERAGRICKLLSDLGIEVDLDQLVDRVGSGSVGRPHLAQALVEAGVCRDQQAAFRDYLRQGRPAFVAAPGLAAPEAIELIHAAGGVACLAHPPRSSGVDSPGGLSTFVSRLADLGLDGLEVRHPSHTRPQGRRLRRLARRLDLIETGGSDFHGGAVRGGMLGQTCMTVEMYEPVRSRIALRRATPARH